MRNPGRDRFPGDDPGHRGEVWFAEGEGDGPDDPGDLPRAGLPPFSLIFSAWLVTFGVAVAFAVCRPDALPSMGLLGAVCLVFFLAALPVVLLSLLGLATMAASAVMAAFRRRVNPGAAVGGVWDSWVDEDGWVGGQHDERRNRGR